MNKKQVSPKRQPGKRASARIVVPKFTTEAEEAAWWYANRHVHAKEFLAAVRNGEVQALTREKLLARIEASKAKAASPVISIRIPEADLEMARRQAARKGLPYQTYLKSLMHQMLIEREQLDKRRARGR